MPVAEALGRVTSEAVWARLSSPHYHASAMDGVAVRAQDTLGASEGSPVRLTLGRQATWVDTGDPLPSGTDAVVMIEHVQRAGQAGGREGLPEAAPGLREGDVVQVDAAAQRMRTSTSSPSRSPPLSRATVTRPSDFTRV